jgi:hypothetical protein
MVSLHLPVMQATYQARVILLNTKGTGMRTARDYKSIYIEPGTIKVTGAQNLIKSKP